MKKISLFLSFITIMLAVAFNVSAVFVVAEEQDGNFGYFIERSLDNKLVDVVSVLEEQKLRYQAKLNAETDETERIKLRKLIADTQKLVEDYRGEKQQKGAKTASVTVNNAPQKAEKAYAPEELDVFFYKSAVSSCVAYFYANGYYLSAELLTHARYNRTLNSLYQPINIEGLEFSEAFANTCEKSEVCGSGAFRKKGDAKDMDLFYAIHQFYYAKFQSGDVITVYDKYDFALDGGFDAIDDIPIEVMYMAQERGVIVPFYTVIETRLAGTEEERADEAYSEIVYKNGEYHLYQSACASDCFAGHSDARRDGLETHIDKNVDGLCDGCDLAVGEVLPQEPPKTEPIIGGVMNGATESAKDVYNTTKNKVANLLNSMRVGCSGSIGGSVGAGAALFVGGLLLKKKKDN